MAENRFYLPKPLAEGPVEIEGDEAHHIIHVMRLKEGARLDLVNGFGELAEAVLATTRKKSATVNIERILKQPPPSFSLIIAQASPRFAKLDMIVEKATELGMTELWLFPGDKSEKCAYSDHQTERLKRIMIAAMKQCGRLYLPHLKFQKPLSEWQHTELPLFFGDLRPGAPTLLSAWSPAHQKGAIFAIGPESGFSMNEVEALLKLKAQGISLHWNILRTETAPIAALSIMSQLQMDRNRNI